MPEDGSVLLPEPEERGHHVAHDATVEGVAGQRHPVGAEDRVLATRLPAQRGTDPEQREVAGAAAEVGDQDELVALEIALVVVGRRDRLVLEDHVGVARVAEGRAQSRERKLDGGLVGGVGEAHRASHHDAPGKRVAALLGLLAQAAQDDADQRLQTVGLAEDRGRAEVAGREEALERLDQAARLIGVEVAVDRLGSGQLEHRAASVLALEVEDRAEGGRLAAVVPGRTHKLGRAVAVGERD